MPVDHSESDLVKAICRKLNTEEEALKDLHIRRRSIDARHQDVKFIYSVECDIRSGEKYLKGKRYDFVTRPDDTLYKIPKATDRKRPVIAGFGPAGIFCAYIFVLAGYKPVVLERGSRVDIREKKVNEFWHGGSLNPDTNVQFGEGGAGAFSDGKLNTLIKDKTGRNRFVLETLARFGAPVNITYDSKPHLGTEVLHRVISSMRDFLLENGADIRFDTTLTDIHIDKGAVTGVTVRENGISSEIEADYLVLAIGHSARDTFDMLRDRSVVLEPKPFAVGFRIEHPRSFIDSRQFGIYADRLPAADYKFTYQTDSGRGVYTFCMCPGGYVINASSEEGYLAVNGMSYSMRDGENSNSAVVVTVNPDDYGEGDDPLKGVRFQRELEKKAYHAGGGLIPVQRFGEYARGFGISFTEGEETGAFGGYEPCSGGGHVFTDIGDILPFDLNLSLIRGIMSFGSKMPGFAAYDACLSAVESRTSSPVRILRDRTGESAGVRGLYPCGEGAGYAGGITSAAMDGIFIAEQIIERR